MWAPCREGSSFFSRLIVTFAEAGQSVGYDQDLVAHRRLGQESDDGTVQVEESSRQHDHTGHQEDSGGPRRVHLLHAIQIIFMFFLIKILENKTKYHGSVFWEMCQTWFWQEIKWSRQSISWSH